MAKDRRMNLTGALATLLLLVAVTWAQSGFTDRQGLPVQQLQVCSDAAWVTCFLNPCMFRRCRYFPQARCQMVRTDCGCRRAWFIEDMEINCINPALTAMQVPARMGFSLPTSVLAPSPNVRARARATTLPSATPTTVAMRTPEVTSGTPALLHCPPGVRRVQCLHDPCSRATCPAAPAAICSADYCGGCFANFFLNGMRVNCFSAPPPSIQTENRDVTPSRRPFTPSSVSSRPSVQVTPFRSGSVQRARSTLASANQDRLASLGSGSDVRGRPVTSQTRTRSSVSARMSSSLAPATSTSAPTTTFFARNAGNVEMTSSTAPATSSQRQQLRVDISNVSQRLERMFSFGTSPTGSSQQFPTQRTGSDVTSSTTDSNIAF